MIITPLLRVYFRCKLLDLFKLLDVFMEAGFPKLALLTRSHKRHILFQEVFQAGNSRRI